VKIHGDNPIGGINIYKKRAESAQKKTAASKAVDGDSVEFSSGDSVEFSSLSQELAKIGNEILSPGDIRKDKVNTLRKQIQAGEYEVNTEALAEKIVNDFVLDLTRKKE